MWASAFNKGLDGGEDAYGPAATPDVSSVATPFYEGTHGMGPASTSSPMQPHFHRPAAAPRSPSPVQQKYYLRSLMENVVHESVPTTPVRTDEYGGAGRGTSSPTRGAGVARPVSAPRLTITAASPTTLNSVQFTSQSRAGSTIAETRSLRRANSVVQRPASAAPPSASLLSVEAPREGKEESIEYTTRPLGDPPVRELNPTAPSQQIRLKHRAATLIQRYAGQHWQAAQRTKWMLDVVAHIDRDYRSYMMDQAAQIKHLQGQIEMMQGAYGGQLHAAQTKATEMEDLSRGLQSQLRDARATILDLQTRLLESESALGVAEQAAARAAQEMADLHQAVSAIAEHDARARKQLALRAHALKDGLRASQAKLRHSTEAARRHNIEVAAMLSLKDQQLATEKANLSSHFMSQIAAVHQVERAAAQVEVAKVKMELEAYKEPWTYAYGKKSPTRNKELSVALGLQHVSLNTLVPV